MSTRRRRRAWRPRRSDLLFGIGAIGFGTQLFRRSGDPTLVGASLLLMGLPIVNRIDEATRSSSDAGKHVDEDQPT